MKAVTMRRVFLFKLSTSSHDLKLFKLSLPGVNCQELLLYVIVLVRNYVYWCCSTFGQSGLE